jgi:ADP-ribose pyrophosphatase
MGSEKNPIIVREEFLCRGKRVSLYKRVVEFEGVVSEKDVVKFGKAVVILPILDDGRVILLKQWRAAVNAWVLEVPAGRVEPSEDVVEAARRELVEETGYEAEELIPMAIVYVSPGYSDEVQTIFLARKLKFIGASPEAGEILKTVYMTPEEVLSMVKHNMIVDAKTFLALLLYLHLYRK